MNSLTNGEIRGWYIANPANKRACKLLYNEKMLTVPLWLPVIAVIGSLLLLALGILLALLGAIVLIAPVGFGIALVIVQTIVTWEEYQTKAQRPYVLSVQSCSRKIKRYIEFGTVLYCDSRLVEFWTEELKKQGIVLNPEERCKALRGLYAEMKDAEFWFKFFICATTTKENKEACARKIQAIFRHVAEQPAREREMETARQEAEREVHNQALEHLLLGKG